MRAEGVREEAEPLSITGEGALSPAWGGGCFYTELRRAVL